MRLSGGTRSSALRAQTTTVAAVLLLLLPVLQHLTCGARHSSRLFILGDELLHEPLVEQVHARAVRAGLPRELLARLGVRHVHDVRSGQSVEAKAREAQVRHELDLVLA